MSPPRIAYAPYSATLKAPGDRRRFAAYAKARNISFELAKPGERYDLVIVTELADITYWAGYSDGTIVYDLIDSYLAVDNTGFHDKFRGAYKFLTGAHRRLEPDYRVSVKAMCRRASAVICSTPEQRTDISHHCANVHVILDAHASVATTRKQAFDSGQVFKIVWEGLPSNLRQLETVRSVMLDLASRRKIELHIVTDPTMPRFLGHLGRIPTIEAARKLFPTVVCHPWEETSCSAIMAACDLAIIPVNLDDPFTRGKPENKLLLLWKIGMPVVASATPAYERAMVGAGLDHVCRTDDEWLTTLDRMVVSEKARKDAAIKGHAYATANFAEEATFCRWDAAFASCGFHFDPTSERMAARSENGLR